MLALVVRFIYYLVVVVGLLSTMVRCCFCFCGGGIGGVDDDGKVDNSRLVVLWTIVHVKMFALSSLLNAKNGSL